jgi:hypothetical protein
MRWTRLSFLYLVGYLWRGGLGLLAATARDWLARLQRSLSAGCQSRVQRLTRDIRVPWPQPAVRGSAQEACNGGQTGRSADAAGTAVPDPERTSGAARRRARLSMANCPIQQTEIMPIRPERLSAFKPARPRTNASEPDWWGRSLPISGKRTCSLLPNENTP